MRLDRLPEIICLWLPNTEWRGPIPAGNAQRFSWDKSAAALWQALLSVVKNNNEPPASQSKSGS